jgi:hypothetical protein
MAEVAGPKLAERKFEKDARLAEAGCAKQNKG